MILYRLLQSVMKIMNLHCRLQDLMTQNRPYLDQLNGKPHYGNGRFPCVNDIQ